MPTKSLTTISTIADLITNDMTLSLYCSGCRPWRDIDADKWVAEGRGDADFTRVRFKCEQCGTVADKQLRANSTKAGYHYPLTNIAMSQG